MRALSPSSLAFRALGHAVATSVSKSAEEPISRRRESFHVLNQALYLFFIQEVFVRWHEG